MRLITRLSALEVARWSAVIALLGRWHRSTAENEFSYHRGLRLLMGMLLVWVVLEVPILVFIGQLLIPVSWLRLVLLIAGVYAVWWVASTWASFIALPHVIRDGLLELHVGTRALMAIPLSNIAAVTRVQRSWSDLLGPSMDDGLVAFPIAGVTSIRIHLLRPSALQRPFRRAVEAADIHLQVDHQETMVTALNGALSVD